MGCKLAMSFITYNRAKHIKEDLERIASQTQKRGILIYIFDGSTNKETENVVNTFIEKGYQHIRYYHYEDSLKERIKRSKDSMLLPDAEYIWWCGDKFLVSPKNYDRILECINQSMDIITIYDLSLHGTKKFCDPVNYVDYSIIPFTHIGAVILKKALITKDIMKKAFKTSFGYWHVILYCNVIIKPEFKGITIHAYGEELKVPSKYNTKSISLDNMWDIWVKDWYCAIMALPDSYDEIRKHLFNKPDRELHFFDLKSLLKQRKAGQFDLGKCMKYRKYIKKVICLPNILVYMIALLPKAVSGKLESYIKP